MRGLRACFSFESQANESAVDGAGLVCHEKKFSQAQIKKRLFIYYHSFKLLILFSKRTNESMALV